MRIAVAGAGIAGVTVAAGLADRGHEVHVYESQRRSTFGRGSFFMVDGPTLQRISAVVDEEALYDSSTVLQGTQLGTNAPNAISGMRQFDRVQLLAALLDTAEARGAVVHFEACVDAVSSDGEDARISTNTTSSEQVFDCAITGDGTFSAARDAREPDVIPRYCGQQVLYATMRGKPDRITAPDDTVHFLSSPDGRATLGYVYRPVRDETSWFARVSVDEFPGLSPRELVGAAMAVPKSEALISELHEHTDVVVAMRAYNVTLTWRTLKGRPTLADPMRRHLPDQPAPAWHRRCIPVRSAQGVSTTSQITGI